jgi:hypothetical protein
MAVEGPWSQTHGTYYCCVMNVGLTHIEGKTGHLECAKDLIPKCPT